MDARASSHWPITITNGAVALLNIFLPLALARILSPDQVGRYNIFFLYVVICPGLFLTGGLTNGLYLWAGRYPEAKSEVRQSWTLLMGLTLAVCSLGLIGVEWAAPVIKIPKLDLQLILLSMPFLIMSTFFEDLMIARGDIWKGSWYGSGFNVFRTASLLTVAWWTRRMEPVFWVFLVTSVIRAAAGWLLVRKGGEIEWLFSWPKTKNVVRYALPVSLSVVAAVALHYVDQLMLSFRLSPAKFAFYAMGCLSIPPLEIFEASVNRVLIPRLSQAFDAKDFSRAAALYAESISELFRFLLPATLGLIIYSKPIIRLLFTDRYLPAADFLRIYALSYLSVTITSTIVARARGDGAWILRTSLFFAVLCTAATWYASGRWDAMGTLIAILSCQLLMRAYALMYNQRSFSVPYSEFLPLKDMGIQTGLALGAGAVSLLLRPLFVDQKTWFFVTGSLFTLLYFAGTYAVSLRRHTRAAGPVHVLELVQTLCLGGLERTVYSLAHTLHRDKRYKVLVAAYDHPEGKPSLVPLFADAGIPLMQWQKGKGFSLRSVFQLVRLTFSERTRIVHVHDLGPLIYGSLAKFFSLGRVRLVLTLHTLLDIEQNPRYRLYYKIFLRFPDRIVAVSPAIRAGLIALGVSPERVEVISNGVPFSYFPDRANEPAEKLALRKQIIPQLSPELYSARWLLCLARLHPGKGQDIVLDVWQALAPEARSKLALFFVGQETEAGYSETLNHRIHALPDNHRIIIAGPSQRPQDWIQSADIFISGSLLEGMPLAPLEAAGSGLPTILSDIEGHRFLESWAHYFDPRKPEEGAKKIAEIIETLRHDGETAFYKNAWNAAASLRLRWGTPAMTASYADTFESA